MDDLLWRALDLGTFLLCWMLDEPRKHLSDNWKLLWSGRLLEERILLTTILDIVAFHALQHCTILPYTTERRLGSWEGG
jgi:hypothetical protein